MPGKHKKRPDIHASPCSTSNVALEVALDNHHVEAAEDLILRRFEIDSDAVVPPEEWIQRQRRSGSYWQRPQVKYLLEHGADPNGNYYMNESPLQWARAKDPEIVDIFLAHGAKDDQGTIDIEDGTDGQSTTNGKGRRKREIWFK
ncbi:hypothetical protein NUU61_006170 [Penicillium alfredii]|uniref:Ankyrin repeat protein n=1 Tax=Penicillium alfredii TaxID=1506179 RepID=A0A9W9F0M7_9EURO|nr:uncharacterized protein NUU61_006170 [Penicillium alfredii]KAJ5091300.1 hypothetical protein NUU61_006170 [Penicillium alfredii]